ncbi:accessory Sec system S-layer assembly protein [Neobacillus sp. D3-1R]|uniref:accessory Sec system S-layer assembly protein n=1 Tax=Neobacillus sp. D3-1R TaxID=3445778 RepID=UPI003FA098A1
MLGFFKRKNKDEKIEKHGTDSVVDSQELLGGEAGEDASTDESVETSLSFLPEMTVSTEERYYFQFLHNELPLLKANQISLAGIELKQVGDEWHVVAFVRNTLSKGIRFEQLPLLLIGPNGEKLGRKEFDLSQLGELPPKSSTPWLFVFNQNDLAVEELPEEGWKLAFELKSKHRLDLAESWEKSLPAEDKDRLAKLVENMEPPKNGEVNFMGIQAQVAENGNLHVTVMVRNGNPKNIKLEQIPLVVEDASGEVVARGGFKLEDFEVKANTSKPWTFIFPKEMVTKENIDLSKWRAYPPQQQ